MLRRLPPGRRRAGAARRGARGRRRASRALRSRGRARRAELRGVGGRDASSRPKRGSWSSRRTRRCTTRSSPTCRCCSSSNRSRPPRASRRRRRRRCASRAGTRRCRRRSRPSSARRWSATRRSPRSAAHDDLVFVTARGEEHVGAHVVIAAPPPPLRAVRFDPPLPPAIAAAIAGLDLGGATKVVNQLRRAVLARRGRVGVQPERSHVPRDVGRHRLLRRARRACSPPTRPRTTGARSRRSPTPIASRACARELAIVFPESRRAARGPGRDGRVEQRAVHRRRLRRCTSPVRSPRSGSRCAPGPTASTSRASTSKRRPGYMESAVRSGLRAASRLPRAERDSGIRRIREPDRRRLSSDLRSHEIGGPDVEGPLRTDVAPAPLARPGRGRPFALGLFGRAGRRVRRTRRRERHDPAHAHDDARGVPRRRRALRHVVRVHRAGQGGRLDRAAARRPVEGRARRRLDAAAPRARGRAAGARTVRVRRGGEGRVDARPR